MEIALGIFTIIFAGLNPIFKRHQVVGDYVKETRLYVISYTIIVFALTIVFIILDDHILLYSGIGIIFSIYCVPNLVLMVFKFDKIHAKYFIKGLVMVICISLLSVVVTSMIGFYNV